MRRHRQARVVVQPWLDDALAALDPVPADETLAADTHVGTLLLHGADTVMTPFIRDNHVWEPAEAAWLRSTLRRGNTAVDVGANIGYFTVLCSKAVGPAGHVVAVEPDEGNLQLLRHNLWLNGCANVRVVPAAAWDERTTLALRRNPLNYGDHQTHTTGGDVLVPAVALDELIERPVHAIKVDTQGSDHRVIDGLRRTLEANPRTPVLTEFWTDSLLERNVSSADVLLAYRRIRPSISLLNADGTTSRADDEQIMVTVTGAPGHWINLVLE